MSGLAVADARAGGVRPGRARRTRAGHAGPGRGGRRRLPGQLPRCQGGRRGGRAGKGGRQGASRRDRSVRRQPSCGCAWSATDAEGARVAAQREVMAKVIVPAYRRSFIRQGWGEACERALALWDKGERRAAAESLPEEMTSSIVLIGSAADVRARFAEFLQTRLDEPIVYAISTERRAGARPGAVPRRQCARWPRRGMTVRARS